MEFLIAVVAFVVGGLTGYGLRDVASKEITALTVTYLGEIARIQRELSYLRTDLVAVETRVKSVL